MLVFQGYNPTTYKVPRKSTLWLVFGPALANYIRFFFFFSDDFASGDSTWIALHLLHEWKYSTEKCLGNMFELSFVDVYILALYRTGDMIYAYSSIIVYIYIIFIYVYIYALPVLYSDTTCLLVKHDCGVSHFVYLT